MSRRASSEGICSSGLFSTVKEGGGLRRGSLCLTEAGQLREGRPRGTVDIADAGSRRWI